MIQIHHYHHIAVALACAVFGTVLGQSGQAQQFTLDFVEARPRILSITDLYHITEPPIDLAATVRPHTLGLKVEYSHPDTQEENCGQIYQFSWTLKPSEVGLAVDLKAEALPPLCTNLRDASIAISAPTSSGFVATPANPRARLGGGDGTTVSSTSQLALPNDFNPGPKTFKVIITAKTNLAAPDFTYEVQYTYEARQVSSDN